MESEGHGFRSFEDAKDAAAAAAAATNAAAAAATEATEYVAAGYSQPRPCIRQRARQPRKRGGFWRAIGLGTSFKRAVQAVAKSATEYGPGSLPGRTFLPPLGSAEESVHWGRGFPSTPPTPEASSRKGRLNAVTPFSLAVGKWYWDHETDTLQYKSPMPSTEIKEKIKKGKSIHFVENDGTTSERLSEKRFFMKRDEKSAKGTDRRLKDDKVTLDDAKYVALFLLQDTEMQRIYSFTTFMRNKNLDEFLMALLYYLSHYLEKLSLEKKPKSYMASHVEKREMELVIEKLQESQKYLAQKYCSLVLGLGMPDKHHMACGKEKISDTQKDWKFFEAFFTFCTYVAWVVFRREHLKEIDEEIGRLFRTNMFNSARRRREDEESGDEKRTMTFVQFRKMMAKRPAIKTTIHLRSPALSTLLPSPKEHAQHLFEKSRSRMGVPLQQSSQKELVNYDSVAMPVVGIIGEPRSLFNPSTLLPSEEEQTPEPTKRNASLINENNAKVQEILELAMKLLGPIGIFTK
ncbi:protein phosphatase 1 regulatory subunit 36 isoform X1 [Sarcophilus harrisii]|uniref:Protein phosphatase 1 regulatory subunit 36 n=2 Tax=Sarcophilus harrisii TaxID=9305 RepID=A0A7N4UYQ5_SARHA|nr:protein phosphatase 1 regulatory subunit 36 isoform X1 [Sarcophilus harrisii]